MFYVLNFENHIFKTCETIDNVKETLNEMSEQNKEDAIVINRAIDGVEMDIFQFQEFCEDYE